MVEAGAMIRYTGLHIAGKGELTSAGLRGEDA